MDRNYLLSELVETMKIAIQECKDKLGKVDYETCSEHWGNTFPYKLLKKHCGAFKFWPPDQYGPALVCVESYTFHLEEVYNEAMKNDN